MCSVPVEEPAAARALWLAQLEESLAAAQRLLPSLPIATEDHQLTQELHLRIQSVRLQVQALRLARDRGNTDVGPKWTDSNPWREGQRP